MPAGRRGADQKAQGTAVPWAGPRALQRPMRIQSCYVQYGLPYISKFLILLLHIYGFQVVFYYSKICKTY
jgi:hypothetical protein